MPEQECRIERRWLLVPSSIGVARYRVSVEVEGLVLHSFETPLCSGGAAEWWAAIDMGAYVGRSVKLSSDSPAFYEEVRWSYKRPDDDSCYGEKLRPLFHFSPKRGWLNDPNGLIFFRGRYHLFYQHNPYFTEWGNMHWGHAVSDDLVHWRELEIALFPDEHGAMFSGSAVWDRENTSGLSREGPMVLIYTGAQDVSVQCLAHSDDGENFAKFRENPVLPSLAKGNRDPKVFRHEASDRWVMVLYMPGDQEQHTIHILSSSNLIDWQPESVVSGGVGRDLFLYECPDLIPMDYEGQTKWVLIGANGEYVIGDFDGKQFHRTSERLNCVVGEVFYAGQSYHNAPDGRVIMVGWLRCASPGMPFNQCMSVPLELSLVSVNGSPRLAFQPVRELERLQEKAWGFGARELSEGEILFESGFLDGFDLTFRIAEMSEGRLEMLIRGVEICYCSVTRELWIGERRVSLPVKSAEVDFRVLGDRTSLEIFVAGGLVYWPLAVVADLTDNMVRIAATRGRIQVSGGVLFEMASAWGG